MARPTKTRQLSALPQAILYLPLNLEGTEKKPHEIAIEDFEVVRLVDGHGLNLSQAAERVAVSKSTAGRMLTRGRRAIALGIENQAPLFFDASENLSLALDRKSPVASPPLPSGGLAVALDTSEPRQSISNLFGRAPRFRIYPAESDTPYDLPNPGATHSRSAAKVAVALLAQHNVKSVAAGRFGPEAVKLLAQAKIAALPLPGLSLEEALPLLQTRIS